MNHFKKLIFSFLFVTNSLAMAASEPSISKLANSSHEELSNHVVQLTPGQSFTIGDTQVMCNDGHDGNCSQPPMETKLCVRKDSFNHCVAYDTTYSVPRGAACTADCVQFDNWNTCSVRNICLYQNNCCFIKKTCVTIDSWDRCAEWSERAICN